MDKPKCRLIGVDGNIFVLMSHASRALVRAGQDDLAREMRDNIIKSESYDEALMIIGKYVDIE